VSWMVPTGSEWGLCVSDVIFSYNACDTFKNWIFDEESNGKSHKRDGWSPEKMGLYVSDVKFLYMTCNTSLNWEFYEKSNGDIYVMDGKRK
jgi:hypothetical protein